jgi:lipoprotein-anchoring transpeptidase ErfK/SrfK
VRRERRPRGRGPRAVTSPRARPLIVLALVGLVAGGCGGPHAHKLLSERSDQVGHAAPTGLTRPAAIEVPKPSRLLSTVAPVRCTTRSIALTSFAAVHAATIVNHAVVRSAPGGGRVVDTLGRLDENGLPTVVGVVGLRTNHGCRPTWYHVKLSVVPNGTAGWVPAHTLRLYRVTSRIVIDLSKRTLRLYRSGKLVLHTTVGIGAPGTPTPVGRFFVNERYVVSPSTGPFGAYALGISAHSTVLEHAWVEQGPIALHGTNEPWSIGEAASHGCVHIANDAMRRVFALATDGTPVTIRA